MKKAFTVVLIIVITGHHSFAQHKSPLKDSLKFIVDLPLADADFGTKNNLFYPSMDQALCASKSFYEATIYGLDRVIYKKINFKPGFLNSLVAGLIYLGYYSTVTYLPLGDSWLHEEYHRAVLQSYNIKSHNDVYYFRFFTSSISVSHVQDSDLMYLKDMHPLDFIRLNEAGYEAQNDLVLAMEKDDFFFHMSSFEHPWQKNKSCYFMNSSKNVLYLFNTLNNILYLRMCSTTEADDETNQFNQAEGKDIAVRDFTGLDFTAWVYDLFRMDELYEKRGIHPSGVGFNRYIKYSDLSNDEKKYLKKQGDLSLLSLIDPALYGFESFTLKRYPDGSALRFNANIKHYLTCYGNSINLNVFIKRKDINMYVSLLNQFNYVRYFPGIDISFIDVPAKYFNKTVFFTPRMAFYSVPANYDFFATGSELGSYFSLGYDYPMGKHFRLHFEGEAKTFGWVAGAVNTSNGLGCKFGVKGMF